MSITPKKKFHWQCIKTWKQSSYNTLWCLIGCSIGDFGTIYFFQITDFNLNTLAVMILAIINGIITSIMLETIILLRQMPILQSFKTALGMSIISMLSMEIVMNILDYFLTGEAYINMYFIPFLLLAGFFSALPYNYWRLKKYNLACH